MNFSNKISDLKKSHLLRSRKITQSAQGTEMKIDSQDVVNFCSNDYLSLANHPLGKYMIAAHLLEIMQQKTPDPIYFQARLICLNKLKDDQIPTVLDLRPLAITCLS